MKLPDTPLPKPQDSDPVRSPRDGSAHVEPPSRGVPPAIIDQRPPCQQHASVGRVPRRRARTKAEGACRRSFGAVGVSICSTGTA
jgi:hypothetical protein